MKYIHIISIPKGDAPLSIRKKWLRLKLPLVENLSSKSVQCGVNGNPPKNEGGYAVNAAQALIILDQSSPKAANWWRRNLPPVPSCELVFAKDVCELIVENGLK
jgi:hypothetical protein